MGIRHEQLKHEFYISQPQYGKAIISGQVFKVMPFAFSASSEVEAPLVYIETLEETVKAL